MLTGAEWLFENVSPLLKELLGRHQGYDIKVIGHAMGAGIGLLYSILLHDAEFPVTFTGFSTPAVISIEVAASVESFSTTVQHDGDCIPSLSLRGMYELDRSLGPGRELTVPEDVERYSVATRSASMEPFLVAAKETHVLERFRKTEVLIGMPNPNPTLTLTLTGGPLWHG